MPKHETELQKLVVDAVNERGGFAFKMSNRFLIGVADLFVKLPSRPVMLLEAKQDVRRPGDFKLGVTVLQRRFLDDAGKAGVECGVLSFVQEPGRNIKMVRVALYSLPQLASCKYMVRTGDHMLLGDSDAERQDMLWKLLERAKL